MFVPSLGVNEMVGFVAPIETILMNGRSTRCCSSMLLKNAQI